MTAPQASPHWGAGEPAQGAGIVKGDLGLLRGLFPFVKADLPVLLAALAAAPFVTALALARPWLVKIALDEHIVPSRLDGLGQVAGLYLAVVLGWVFLDVGSTLAMAWVGQRSVRRLRSALYSHTIRLSASFFDRHETGALMTRLTSDLEALGETLTSRVVTVVLDLLVMVGTIVAMFLLDWRITLLLLTIAPPVALVVETCRRNLRRLFVRIRSALAATNAFMAERMAGLEALQLFGAEERSYSGFRALNRDYRDAAIVSNFWDALLYAFMDGASAVAVALLLWYGSGDLGVGASIGVLVAFVQYLERLFQPLREISSKISIIQRAMAALGKVMALLDSQDFISNGDLPLPADSGHLVARNLSFAYNAHSPPVLHGVDLEVLPGQVVALVGPSGSGKTTLCRLLSRSYQGYGGSLELDGVQLSRIHLPSLRRAMVTVSQEIQLFPDTVRFNIDLGSPEISLEQVEEAARIVHAHDFITQLDGGYQHLIDSGGGGISVGQSQLLTFARTMAHQARIVVLDEATASIDSMTEALVQDALARILERKTVLVVAHRLSTIKHAHMILVMERGRIVERGSHRELLARGGLYARLHAKGFEDSA